MTATGSTPEIRVGAAAGAGAAAILGVANGIAFRLDLFTLDFGRMLGTILRPDALTTRSLGWVLHVMNGALGGAAYAAALAQFDRRRRVGAGAALGLVQFALAMLLLAVMPRLHPRPSAGGLRRLGPFAYGPMTVPAMALGHALYGAAIGVALAAFRGRST